VSLELLDSDGKRVNVGNVTIPANQAIPPAGAVAEIKYLYCHVGGSLYQPVFLGVRDDIGESACVVGQLKYKAGGEEDER
jgi:bifunctional non-homologous end joining protein LigD